MSHPPPVVGRCRAVPRPILAAAFALLAAPATAQVTLFQHCDFNGWSAEFTTTGNFDTAAILDRGGINNDASSIRIEPGFPVTLYSGNNQTGRSLVLTADNNCFVVQNFNDIVSSLKIEGDGPPPGGAADLFQHCNFGGWQASFPAGSFNTAAIVARGGIDNDASSIRIRTGFKARLFDGNGLSGRSIELAAGDTVCFVDQGFNDVLSSLSIEADTGNPPGQCVPGDEIDPDNPPTPGATIGDWIGGHNTTMTRHSFDRHVVIWVDDQVNRNDIGWLQDLMSRSVRYAKKTYDPAFHYGPDRLHVFVHQGRFGGGTISSYFDAFSSFRNATDGGANNWGENADNRIARDIITHELAHIVEGSSNGVHESPGFGVWLDSKWAEFFQYDLYKALGLEQDATRVFNRFMAGRDGFPAPNTAWFRDWFFPLWQDGGGTCRGGDVMGRFFRLLKDHFPTRSENGGRNRTYSRRMTLEELVHFTSGAAGRDLSARAEQAFREGFNRAEFEQARRDFPGIQY